MGKYVISFDSVYSTTQVTRNKQGTKHIVLSILIYDRNQYIACCNQMHMMTFLASVMSNNSYANTGHGILRAQVAGRDYLMLIPK